jgi:hypothetical protein
MTSHTGTEVGPGLGLEAQRKGGRLPADKVTAQALRISSRT